MAPRDTSCDDFLVKVKECQDQEKRIFSCCNQVFYSVVQFERHNRIHNRRIRAKSKTSSSKKVERKNYPLEDDHDDNGFRCFICHRSFLTMQLLIQHTRNHPGKPPMMSEEENYLCDEPQTYSVQDQRANGQKRTVNGEIVYDPQPLSVYFPPVEERVKDSVDSYPSKKLKSEGTNPNQVASMESGSKANFSHRRSKSHNRANSNTGKSVHQCEICGKIFEKGQSLGGHKTYHRNKQLSDDSSTFRGLLMVRTKAEEQLPAETSMVTERNLTRMFLPGAVNLSGESYQEHSPFPTQSNLPSFNHSGRPERHKSANFTTVCEIYGKTFETGQALGGHKTYHRNKQLSDDPFRPGGLLIVHRKAEEQLSAETSAVRETLNLTSIILPGTTNSSEESHPNHSQSKMLDFDLNTPHVGEEN